MPDYKAIYENDPEGYDRLVDYEDYQHNLIACLERIAPLGGSTVVELGAGTGRITRQLAPRVASVHAFDLSPAMIERARARAASAGLENATFAVAENRQIPLPDGGADLVIEGWSVGHMVSWEPERWRDTVREVVGEMRRLVRTGGAVIIIETLGTGNETPAPPAPFLADLYAELEEEYGFVREWIRMDYEFPTPRDAVDATRFFFGDELAVRVARSGSSVVPECTGVWYSFKR